MWLSLVSKSACARGEGSPTAISTHCYSVSSSSLYPTSRSTVFEIASCLSGPLAESRPARERTFSGHRSACLWKLSGCVNSLICFLSSDFAQSHAFRAFLRTSHGWRLKRCPLGCSGPRAISYRGYGQVRLAPHCLRDTSLHSGGWMAVATRFDCWMREGQCSRCSWPIAYQRQRCTQPRMCYPVC